MKTSYGALVLVAAICIVFQAAVASELSIYKGPNCFQNTKVVSVDCTDGHGVGKDHACINFDKYNNVAYTFKYQGTPLRLYYSTNCGGNPAVFSNDIGCTQVSNAVSYKLLCNDKGY